MLVCYLPYVELAKLPNEFRLNFVLPSYCKLSSEVLVSDMKPKSSLIDILGHKDW
jgi:hypothetical protein